jgi:hypothetical protein
MRFSLPALYIVCLLSANQVYSQGCSDAGFCTIGSIKPHDSDSMQVKRQKLSLLLGNGVGDENVYVFTPGIQYDNNLSPHWDVQARLTANYTNGNLGKAAGLGDVFLTGIYTPANNSKWKLSFLFGTKLPLNSGDIRVGNKPLPMQYQSSLGTIDVIAGITITDTKWLFATAVQQPVSGKNRNTFLPVYWQTPEADKYPPTNDFNRKGDVLLRVVYTITVPEKLRFNLGLLSIYHLGKDTYVDGNVSNSPIKIDGSEGLTLNGTVAAWYKINTRFTVGLSGGAPFKVRDIRPDGLTRKIVVTSELIMNF